MRLIAIYANILLPFFLNCSFLLAMTHRKRGNCQVERMLSYNTLLCSIVDNSFSLLKDSKGSHFLICPTSGGGSKLFFALGEVKKIILKIDKMSGWPDSSGMSNSGNGETSLSPLERAIGEHVSVLNEYWCYLEGADLDARSFSERKVVSDARFSVLEGMRNEDVAQISRGASLLHKYKIPTPFPVS